MKIPQSKRELLGHMEIQIDFLKRSAQSYDKGFEAEAIRLAVAIRILVHDTPKSKSLLRQLNKKNILFYDTASDFNLKNIMTHIGLAAIELGGAGGAEYSAHFDDVPPHRLNKKVPFGNWWNKIVIVDKERNQFTRKDLVLFVANKDGGAHIDPSLDKKYAELSRFNSMAWKVIVGGVESPFKNRPELACIRQITHEVLKTLKDEFPEYFQSVK
jgi:hypothetical protein